MKRHSRPADEIVDRVGDGVAEPMNVCRLVVSMISSRNGQLLGLGELAPLFRDVERSLFMRSWPAWRSCSHRRPVDLGSGPPGHTLTDRDSTAVRQLDRGLPADLLMPDDIRQLAGVRIVSARTKVGPAG